MGEVKNIFDISGRAMSAQLLRLNTVASNLANANNVSGSAEDAYRAIKPVFETKYAESFENSGVATVDAVNVKAINRQPVSPSLDGNTVEMAVEQIEFSENVVRYQTSLTFLNNRISGLLSAIKGE